MKIHLNLFSFIFSRAQNVGGTDGASPYKRPRAQSPGAVQGTVPPAPQQRPGAYPYPQDTAARYAGMAVPTSYPVYREPYQVGPKLDRCRKYSSLTYT